MTIFCRFNSAFVALLVTGASLAPLPANADGLPSYDPSKSDQYVPVTVPDLIPKDAEARKVWAHGLSQQAFLYARAPALLYRQMYKQAVDRKDAGYTGFDKFAHGRDLAGPTYAPFKSPNADTLYSNAWLDLRNGPVELSVPDTGKRYYTVNFQDYFGNASNISTRTHGNKGGRYWIADVNWQGHVPDRVTLFRVNTPIVWILMRVLVADRMELQAANALQDKFVLRPVTQQQAPASDAYPAPDVDNPLGQLKIFDWVARQIGHPVGEAALLHQFERLGIGGGVSPEQALANPAIKSGVELGFADATMIAQRSALNNTNSSHNGWALPGTLGRYGFNYTQRAAVHTVGTGPNVADENYASIASTDAGDAFLDGSKGRYEIRFSPPPPADYFWSITAYDVANHELVANPIDRYFIGDRTLGMKQDKDGSITLVLQHARPPASELGNWLPVPDKPFYLIMRIQGPKKSVLDGEWLPPAVVHKP